MNFAMADGRADTNNSEPLNTLYGISCGIKFPFKKKKNLLGYFEYVVPSLEGLWWVGKDRKETTAR